MTNLETASSLESKLSTSKLLNYEIYPKTVNLATRIKKYYLKLISIESQTDYREEHYARLA